MIERLAALLGSEGDVGHIALFLWAASASALSALLVRDLAQTTARYEAFVMAIARLNALLASQPRTRGDDISAAQADAANTFFFGDKGDD